MDEIGSDDDRFSSDSRHVLKPIRGNQISLSTIMGVTAALALLLGYAVNLGPQAIWMGLTYVAFVLFCGLVNGALRRDWKNALFWGGLYAMLAYLAVADSRLLNRPELLGWGIVGAAVGSTIGTQSQTRLFSGIAVGATVGWLSMSSLVLLMRQPLSDAISFDPLTAAVVGGLLKPFTMTLCWFERESSQSRFLIASWLAISVIAGNALVPILTGVQL